MYLTLNDYAASLVTIQVVLPRNAGLVVMTEVYETGREEYQTTYLNTCGSSSDGIQALRECEAVL